MCGQYTLFEDENPKMRGIVAEMNARLESSGEKPVKTGIIKPTDRAPVFVANSGEILSCAMDWGYAGFGKSRIIINARAETATQKPMFSQGVARFRCVVPATGFYEWNRALPDKPRYRFGFSESPALYMAGLYQQTDGFPRFVIVTCPARGALAQIHDRMPVILMPDKLTAWLGNAQKAQEILHTGGAVPQQIPDLQR